jgi:hypothetical protein
MTLPNQIWTFAFAFAACTVVLGCGGKEDTEDPIDTGEADTFTYGTGGGGGGCEVVEVGFDGPEPPHVGDKWTVWPICDGVVTTGAAVIRVDPADSGSLAENEITFLYAATVTVTVQTGPDRGEMVVEVLD